MAAITGSVGLGGKNNPPDVSVVQTMLGTHWDWLGTVPAPVVTARLDEITVAAISAFQANAAVLAAPDGVVSPGGFTLRQLERPSIPKPRHRVFLQACWYHMAGSLSLSAFATAAETLGCKASAVQAVAQTETKRAAWEALGRPTMLFERHYFHRLTNHSYDRTHPDISNAMPGKYGLFSAQFAKLRRAAVLDEQAALQSASWGSFQIMGANYAQAGFTSVAAFVDAMMESEKRHLAAFTAFILGDKRLQSALKDLRWADFARDYNGKNFKKNDYDGKMAAAYASLCPATVEKIQAGLPQTPLMQRAKRW